MKYCKVKDCEEKHHAKGYCNIHYRRYSKYGDPNTLLDKHVEYTCIINECNGEHVGKGYCAKHYARFRQTGDPNKVSRIYNSTQGCLVDFCDNVHFAKGLCNKHYGLKWARKNKDKINAKNRKLHKENPEKRLIIMKRHLKKYGKTFDMNPMGYLYALVSWSKTIKKLDNHICKNCNSTKNLHSHHIYPKSQFPKLALDLDNGITLCKKCHEKTHGYETYQLSYI